MPTKPYVVVVGADFSPQAEKALLVAYEHACRFQPAELHVAHATLAVTGATDFTMGSPYPALAAQPTLTWEEQQAQLVAHLDAVFASRPELRQRGIRIVAHTVLNAPVFALVNLASQLEANLLVVGSHGRRGVSRILLGSVAEGVVRNACCPVLVIPPEPQSLPAPAIEPPCPKCVEARALAAGHELWCEQHRERHGRRHVYHQGDRMSAPTNFPLVAR